MVVAAAFFTAAFFLAGAVYFVAAFACAALIAAQRFLVAAMMPFIPSGLIRRSGFGAGGCQLFGNILR